MKKRKIRVLQLTILILIGFPLILGQDAFNLEIELPKSSQKVSIGDTLWFTTKILNLNSKERIDITLRYRIIDSKGEPIITKSETVAVETQASFVGSIKIPDDVNLGKHTLHSELMYKNEKRADANHSFEIIKKSFNNKINTIFLVLSLIILIIIVFIILKSKIIYERIKIRLKIHGIVKKRFKR